MSNFDDREDKGGVVSPRDPSSFFSGNKGSDVGRFSTDNVISLDDDVKINRLERLSKMKNGETNRIAFILADNRGQPLLRQTQVFNDDVGKRTYLAPEDKAIYRKYQEKFGNARMRFGTIVLLYRQDARDQSNIQAKPVLWVFSTDKWPQLKEIHKVWNLMTRDLVITCIEETFQRMSMQPAPEKWFDFFSEDQKQALLAEARDLFQDDLYKSPAMGMKQTQEQINQTLGISSSVPQYNPFATPGFQQGSGNGSVSGLPGPGVGQVVAPSTSPSSSAFDDLVK